MDFESGAVVFEEVCGFENYLDELLEDDEVIEDYYGDSLGSRISKGKKERIKRDLVFMFRDLIAETYHKSL